MQNERIIKKYPNRRLYDTKTSKYITVADVRELVLRGEQFNVVDTSSKEDITRQILMQIIIEEETAGKPLFSADMLAQLIRFYGGTMQGMFSQFLQESMSVFAKQQEEVTKNITANPMEAFTRMTQQNLEMLSDMQKNFLKSAGLDLDKDKDKNKDQ